MVSKVESTSGRSVSDFSYLSRQGRWKAWVQGKAIRMFLSVGVGGVSEID